MAICWRRLLLPLLLIAPMGLAQASDLAREQRLAAQIEEAILVGDAVRLRADGSEFLAIHTEAETEPRRGGLVLLHGMGAHPDWPEIINPLRSELPALGWETLSIQLPVAAADAGYSAYLPLFPEAGQRIAAAIAYLQQRGDGPVYLLAHSLGSTMAVDYLAAQGGEASAQVAGLIAIGLSADPDRLKSGTLAALARLRLPILDLYGSEDVESVRSSAAARKRAASAAGNLAYTQQRVDGADHFFHDREQPLLDAVSAWLEQHSALPSDVSGQQVETSVGKDRDSHDCIASAGSRWCARIGQCTRPWVLSKQQGFPSTEAAFREYCDDSGYPAAVDGQ